MHKLVFLFLLVCLLSLACHKDNLITCDCSKLKYGQLCQQFVFLKEKCIRYETYTYTSNDSVATKHLDYPGAGYNETYTYIYNSNNTIQKITLKKSSDISTFLWTYEYNDKNQLSKKSYFKGKKLQYYSLFEYNNNLQLAHEFIYNSSEILDTLRSYNYFTDDRVMRVITTDAVGAIYYYKLYEFYDNNISKILFYDKNNIIQSIYVYKKNEQNLLNEVYYNDSENNIVFREDRTFNNQKNLIKRSCFDKDDNLTSYAILKYSGQ